MAIANRAGEMGLRSMVEGEFVNSLGTFKVAQFSREGNLWSLNFYASNTRPP